jgi:hypothetical protein
MSSTFNYSQYQQIAAQEQANASGDGTKVGYFRLKDDGDIAIARINISSTDEFMFAAVHTINAGGKWIKVSCHNPLGMNAAGCALCSANQANPKGSISKSTKKMYIPMVVSYRDPQSATGYTPPAPVIWERPAGFSRELANKLMVAGDLKNALVLITRNGKAGDMQTTYSVDVLPAAHPVFKPEMIPADFSAFNNFNIAKHSYWEKSAEEINTFLTTGQFPERQAANTQQAVNNVAAVASAYTAPATATPTYAAPVQPATPAYVAPAAPQQAPAAPAYTAPSYTQPAVPTAPVSAPGSATTAPGTPVRNFSGFSF